MSAQWEINSSGIVCISRLQVLNNFVTAFRQGFRRQGWKDVNNGQGDKTSGLFSILRSVLGPKATSSEVKSKYSDILEEAKKYVNVAQ